MKKVIRIATLALLASASLLLVATPVQARVDWNVNIGVPAPVYYPPAPIYYEPAPVYIQPRPVYVQPRPIYVEQQPYYEYRRDDRRRVWGHEWREHREHHDREWRGNRDHDERD